jgi:Universal stress protein family
LIGESRHAAIICVGSIGIGQVARRVIGSTADAVAQKADCPVAIIRYNRDADESGSGSIAVVVDESPDNDAVLEHGFREARLRGAPILALGVWRWGLGEIPYHQLEHRLGRWVSEYRDVHVRPVAARGGAAEFLTNTQESVQLAVVDSSDADKVARMVGPITPHFGHSGRSVLVVRK